MSIVSLHGDGTGARRLLVAAGALALAATLPDESLRAQAPSGIPIADALVVRSGATGVTLRSPSCLALHVVPGDTSGRAMPRAPGDTLADPRMPRGGGFAPSCARAAGPAVARRPFRMPDGRFAIPAPKATVPSRP